MPNWRKSRMMKFGDVQLEQYYSQNSTEEVVEEESGAINNLLRYLGLGKKSVAKKKKKKQPRR